MTRYQVAGKCVRLGATLPSRRTRYGHVIRWASMSSSAALGAANARQFRFAAGVHSVHSGEAVWVERQGLRRRRP